MRSEFDKYASEYQSLHNQSLTFVGAESLEFVRAKLHWCREFAARNLNASSSAKQFLDYGCGIGRTGHEFYDYFDRSWNYQGVDESEECISLARSNVQNSKTSHTGKEPIFCAVSAWDNSLEQYDLILAACVFHHIPPVQRPAVLQNLWHALRPGGAIVVWEHNPWNPLTRKIVKDCVFDKDAILLTTLEIGRLWRSAIGCGQTGTRFVTFFPGLFKKLRALEYSLGWLPLGGQWVFWAKKPREEFAKTG